LVPISRAVHRRQTCARDAPVEPPRVLRLPTYFRGEDTVLAAAAKRRAEKGLGPAAIAIDIGGVEKVDADFDRRIDHRPGLFKVEPSSEIVASKAQRRNHEAGAAECALDHGLLQKLTRFISIDVRLLRASTLVRIP